MERVAVTEMSTVTGVRNATIMATATVGSNGLSLLPSGLLRLLCALWLLALCLLCVLLWFRFLCSLLGRRFLCALLRLRLLCVLLRLSFLRVLLRLRLVLRRLSLSTASALFLLSFLCYCRNGGSEKQ